MDSETALIKLGVKQVESGVEKMFSCLRELNGKGQLEQDTPWVELTGIKDNIEGSSSTRDIRMR
jgi:hypothetical protein